MEDFFFCTHTISVLKYTFPTPSFWPFWPYHANACYYITDPVCALCGHRQWTPDAQDGSRHSLPTAIRGRKRQKRRNNYAARISNLLYMTSLVFEWKIASVTAVFLERLKCSMSRDHNKNKPESEPSKMSLHFGRFPFRMNEPPCRRFSILNW
jgi:hypothetical protein